MGEKMMFYVPDVVFFLILFFGMIGMYFSVQAWIIKREIMQDYFISVLESVSLMFPALLYYPMIEFTDFPKWFCTVVALWGGSLLTIMVLIRTAREIPYHE